MLKIDIHTHIMPKESPKYLEKFGYGGFIHLEHRGCDCANMVRDDGKFFRAVKANCWDAESRLKDCEQHDVNVQVLSPIPVMFYYWAKPKDTLETARFLNDFIQDIVNKYPRKFIGLGTVPMQDPQLACEELQRIMKNGMAGVEIGSNINDINLGDPVFDCFWQTAEQLNAAVFVHPWQMMGAEKMEKYWLPWLVGMPAETSRAICSMIFSGVMERYKNLNLAFAHGGGSFPFTVGRIQHGFDVRPDLCALDNPVPPKNYLGSFIFDSLVHDPVVLKYLVDLVGAENVALGTDYPFPLGELQPGKMIQETELLTFEQKQMLMHGTALRWLNKQKSQYIEV